LASAVVNQLGQAEIRAFWLLFQLTGGLGRQSFRDYYGIPRKNMVATGGPQSWEGVAGWMFPTYSIPGG